MANIVTAGFENQVPRNDLFMVSIMATFKYTDGSSETVGPKAVHLATGQDAVLMSSATTKCCNEIIGYPTMQQDGFGPHQLSKVVTDANCMLVYRFIVAPTVAGEADMEVRTSLVASRPPD